MLLRIRQYDIGDGFSCTFLRKLNEMDPTTSKMGDALSVMHECFQPIGMELRGKKIEMFPSILSSRW